MMRSVPRMHLANMVNSSRNKKAPIPMARIANSGITTKLVIPRIMDKIEASQPVHCP